MSSSLLAETALLPWMFILTQKEVALENNQVLSGHLFIADDDFLDNIFLTPVTVFIPRVPEYLRYDGNSISRA